RNSGDLFGLGHTSPPLLVTMSWSGSTERRAEEAIGGSYDKRPGTQARGVKMRTPRGVGLSNPRSSCVGRRLLSRLRSGGPDDRRSLVEPIRHTGVHHIED